ncbi:hypothetical protein HN670_01145 [bacterium]|jgi:hypothetical protein|nr:hypothetical protein [bacterium]
MPILCEIYFYRPKSEKIPESTVPPDWRELRSSLIRFAIKPSKSKIRAKISGANNLSKANKISNCMNFDIHLFVKTKPEDNIEDDGQPPSSNGAQDISCRLVSSNI